MIVGNKLDLSNMREVSTEEAAAFCRSRLGEKGLFLETSAKEDIGFFLCLTAGIEQVFEGIAKTLVENCREADFQLHRRQSEFIRVGYSAAVPETNKQPCCPV